MHGPYEIYRSKLTALRRLHGFKDWFESAGVRKFIIIFYFIFYFYFFLYLFISASRSSKNSSDTVFTVKPRTPLPITVIYLNFEKVTFTRNVNKYRQAYKQCRSSADCKSWSTLFLPCNFVQTHKVQSLW